MNLKDKRIVLTGASSGIGLELLPILDQKGAKVLAVGRRSFDPHLSSVTYIRQDISTQNGVEQVFQQASDILGGIDIFIANAGFAYYESAHKADWDRSQVIFNTNTISPIYAYKKLKRLKDKKPFQFVITASAISYLPLPGYALYSATKHAVQGFFEATRHELPKNQIISLIHPIATKTAFFDKNTPVPFPSQSVKTVAKIYIRGIEKNKAHIFPSKIFWFIRHLTFLQPLIQKRNAKKIKKWQDQHE